MITFIGVHEDIIELICQNLHCNSLLNVLMTCKHLYANRKHILANNAMISTYTKYNGSFMSAYFASDITYDDMQIDLKFVPSASSKEHVYNTYKMLAFHTKYYSVKSITIRCRELLYYYYSRQMEERNYAYYATYCKSLRIASMFMSFMHRYNWLYTNIDLFDIYQCMFHIKFKNHRDLAHILQDMQIIAPQDIQTFLDICKSLSKYINNSYDTMQSCNKLIKAVMIYILYKFIEVSPLEFIEYKVRNALVENAALQNEIMLLKYIPKYIKNIIREQIIRVICKLTQT